MFQIAIICQIFSLKYFSAHGSYIVRTEISYYRITKKFNNLKGS